MAVLSLLLACPDLWGMIGIAKHQGHNHGGLHELYYAPLASFSDTQKAQLRTATTLLDFAPSGGWLLAEVLPQRKQLFDFSWVETNQNGYYNARVSAVAPRLRQSVTATIEEMHCAKTFLVKAKDANGQYWILGTGDQPLLFQSALKTGETEFGLNHYALSWTGKVLRPPIRSKT